MDTRSFRRRRGAATLVGLLLLSFSVAARAGDLLGERLEETTGLPPGAGQELGEREMGELRGGFVVDGNFLAYFSIEGLVVSAVAAGQSIDATFHVGAPGRVASAFASMSRRFVVGSIARTEKLSMFVSGKWRRWRCPSAIAA